MKEETRYRVTGSLFLLALVVICLPMLLDGEGLPARDLPALTLPEAPAATRSSPASSSRSPGPSSRPGAEPAQSPSAAEGADGAGGDPGPDQSIDTDFLSRVERLRSTVDEDGFLAGSGTRFGEPVLTPARADTEVWAIQVASFADGGNAEGFRERLRQDGYEAFIATARADGRVLRRVAVGPLLDQQRAAALQSELSTRYDVQARLVSFAN